MLPTRFESIKTAKRNKAAFVLFVLCLRLHPQKAWKQNVEIQRMQSWNRTVLVTTQTLRASNWGSTSQWTLYLWTPYNFMHCFHTGGEKKINNLRFPTHCRLPLQRKEHEISTCLEKYLIFGEEKKAQTYDKKRKSKLILTIALKSWGAIFFSYKIYFIKLSTF